MHGDHQLVRCECEMRAAIFDVKLAHRGAPAAVWPGDLDFRAERQQGGRQVAREGRMASLALRRHVTGIAAVLEAIAVGAPPPFALVVVDAARIEAEVAADRGHRAVAGTCDASGGFRQGTMASADLGMVSQSTQCHHRADAGAARGERDLSQFVDCRQVELVTLPLNLRRLALAVDHEDMLAAEVRDDVGRAFR